MSSKGSVIYVGLPVDHPAVKALGADPEVIAKGIQMVSESFTSEGYDYITIYASPEEGLANFSDKLKEKHWDCVVIGAGVRLNAPLTPFLEDLVNTVKDVSPKSRIAFNTNPQTTLEAVKRGEK